MNKMRKYSIYSYQIYQWSTVNQFQLLKLVKIISVLNALYVGMYALLKEYVFQRIYCKAYMRQNLNDDFNIGNSTCVSL